MSAQSLRVLVVLKHAGYLGVFSSLVQELAARGHHVHVGFLSGADEGRAAIERMPTAQRLSASSAPARGALDGWSSVGWLARALGDLGRYADPRFSEAHALRARMAAKVRGHLSNAAGFDPLTRRIALGEAQRLEGLTDAEAARRAIGRSEWLEAGVPVSRVVREFVERQRPDLVLVSPLIELASPLLEYLKAARRLRLPTGICVASWDNLTSKGLLRFVPERVFVWNEIQRREAAELHAIPPDRIVATGAARFDEWFARQTSTTREYFMRSVGLDPTCPYLLYLCSSAFVVNDEVASVSRWLSDIRGSGHEGLRRAGVLVRPHPKRTEPWRDVDLSAFENVLVWPHDVGTVDGAAGRPAFYDSIAHSAGVVGVNTSAMLEAAIVGKRVYTLVSPQFAQESTLHFHYLLQENGGFLHVAESKEEHLDQLAAGLEHEGSHAEQVRSFVESFLRPAGSTVRATAVYADAVEELGRMQATKESDINLGLRVALAPLALASSAALVGRVGKSAMRSRLPRGRDPRTTDSRVGTVRA